MKWLVIGDKKRKCSKPYKNPLRNLSEKLLGRLHSPYNRTSAPAYLNLEDQRYAFLVFCRVGGMEIDFPVARDDSEGPGMAT